MKYKNLKQYRSKRKSLLYTTPHNISLWMEVWVDWFMVDFLVH